MHQQYQLTHSEQWTEHFHSVYIEYSLRMEAVKKIELRKCSKWMNVEK